MLAVFVAFLSVPVLLVTGSISCELVKPVREIEGNLILTGLFPLHHGTNCSDAFLPGSALLSSAKWTIRKLNDVGFFPQQVKLGLDVWDTCNTKPTETKLAVRAIADSLMAVDSCRTPLQAGLLGTHETPELITQIAEGLNIPFAKLPQPDMDDQLLASLQVLMKMGKETVTVVAQNSYQLERFGDLAAEKGICVVSQFVFPSVRSTENYTRMLKRLQKSGIRTTILIDNSGSLKKVLEVAEKDGMTQFEWFFISTNELQTKDFADYPTIAPGLVAVFLKYGELLDIPVFQDAVGVKRSEPIEVHEILTTIRATYSVCLQIRQYVNDKCNATVASCGYDNLQFRDILTEDFIDFEKDLGVKTSAIEIVVATVSDTLLLTKLGEATGASADVDLTAIDTYRNNSDSDNRAVDCTTCLCTNMDRSFLDNVGLKDEIWVYVSITISSLGILICIAICIYVCVRVCNADSIEGSQGFTILILISLIILYASIAPYIVPVSELICWLRTPITILSYSLLFSFIAARAIMLSTADSSDAAGHISGFVQSTLFVLMFGVQVAMTVTDLIYSNSTFSFKVVTDSGPKVVCRSDWLSLLISYSYILCLLFILLLTTPFSTRSKRNYKEGPSFCVSTYLTVVAWGLWVFGFFYFDARWNDFCIVIGIVATATIQLLTVFIPKTYMMATSIAADAVSITMRQTHLLPDRNTRPVYETIQVPSAASHYGPEPTRASYMHYSDPASPKKSEF